MELQHFGCVHAFVDRIANFCMKIDGRKRNESDPNNEMGPHPLTAGRFNSASPQAIMTLSMGESHAIPIPSVHFHYIHRKTALHDSIILFTYNFMALLLRFDRFFLFSFCVLMYGSLA